ncbi:uncharacterized protein CTRU02_215378 [Colletotrichum truncatum]|uniref:Uncharacterized protein n=1 Tax=Colletotrichum truncatum TaxID=5467 RepID=A0ACC3YD26_COLTU
MRFEFLETKTLISQKLGHTNITYIRPTLWLILFQATGIGVLSHSSKQIALVLWNVFPVWVLVVMIGLQAVFPLAHGAKSNVGSRKESDAAPQETHRRHIANVSLVYAPALIVSLHSHIAVLTVSISTCLFPALFRSEYLAYLRPSEVFVPPLAITIGQTTGDGTRSFMLWDQIFGYGTVMMVMLLRLQAAASAAGRPLGWVKLVAATLLASLVVGPGSTCLLISWLRDILLFVQ